METKKQFLTPNSSLLTNTAGVDEAGRGALVAEVYAAAVVLPQRYILPNLTDSKKLTAKKRELLFLEIQNQALDFCVATASAAEIDELNIHKATLLAMKRAILGLKKVKPTEILIDGKFVPEGLENPARAIVGGDSLIPAISAASILAKVSRDKKLLELDGLYPQYGFAKHKGYGTKAHLDAIKKYGVLDIHRKSYRPVKELGVRN